MENNKEIIGDQPGVSGDKNTSNHFYGVSYCNLLIGFNAGHNLTTGSYNILIGDNAGSELTTESFILIIAGAKHQMKDVAEFHQKIKEVEDILSYFNDKKVKFPHLNGENGNQYLGHDQGNVTTTGN